MKRNLCMPAALLLTAVMLTGCGTQISTPDDKGSVSLSSTETDSNANYSFSTDGYEKLTILEDGREVITMPDGTMIVQNDNGYEWSYLGGTCQMTLPNEWANRFTVRGTSVYCKKCFQAQEGAGELFSLQFVNESSFVQGTKPAVLLGMVRKMYAVAVIPAEENYDTSDETLDAEYQDMRAALSSVFQTAVCEGNTDFTPIELSGYVSAPESADNTLFGSWEAKNPADTSQIMPYVTFRSRDSAVGYHYAQNGVTFGSFLISQNPENEAGLAFMDGRVFRLIHTPGEPRTVAFELILKSNEVNDTLDGQSFYWVNDTETIYQSDAEVSELEF